MTREAEGLGSGMLLAVVQRLLGSDHWCESWAHGCSVDCSLAVLERVSQLPGEGAAGPTPRVEVGAFVAGR